jgi:hypothetical protein
MDRNKGGPIIVLSAVLICLGWMSAGTARADDSNQLNLVSVDQPMYAVTFPDDKRWDVEVLGTGLADVTNRHVGMGGMTVGAGYYVLKNLAIQMDFSAYGFGEGHTQGAAGGVTIGLRHHIVNIGKALIFADVSFGEIWASNNLPVHGTHRNNTFEFGIGVAYPIGQDVYLIGGPRFFHLSNANDAGSDRNPSINAVQGVIGVLWKF